MYNVSENYDVVFKNCYFETTSARYMKARKKECKRNLKFVCAVS